MRRLTGVWMEFKGETNRQHNCELLGMPTRYSPALNGEAKSVSGQSGTVLVTDGSFRDVEITVTFDLRNGERMSEVNAWLSGSGLLRFSDEPNLAYEARILRNFRHSSFAKRLDGQTYSVTFTCKPFRVRVPAVAPITVSASGTTLYNPGTAPARPVVTITGSGDFTVTIAGQSIDFTGVSGGILVDCEQMDALDPTRTTLLNDRIDGRPWEIPPGAFAVEWDTTEGGSVASVALAPNWRWM